jgi:hypothetical protein
MRRLLSATLLSTSLVVLALGSTAALASNACNGLTCEGHKGNSQTSPTCTSGDPGCTSTPTTKGNGNKPPGQPCTSPDALCSK